MSDDKHLYATEDEINKGATVWSQALPELRWVWRSIHPHGYDNEEKVLQQRWRIVTEDGKPPRHEWRDVPTVKEG